MGPIPPSSGMLEVAIANPYSQCRAEAANMWAQYWTKPNHDRFTLWTYCAYLNKKNKIEDIRLIKCDVNGVCNEQN